MRCKSCSNRMTELEMSKKIILEDGSYVYEEFCSSCLNKYIDKADFLDDKFHACDHISRPYLYNLVMDRD